MAGFRPLTAAIAGLTAMAAGQPGARGGQPVPAEPPYSLDCVTAGAADAAAGEDTSSRAILITNIGADRIPGGTRIRWARPSGQQGQFVLGLPLEGNRQRRIENVLGAPAAAGQPCTARVEF